MSIKCSGTCLDDAGSRRMVLSLTEQNIVMRVAGLLNEEGNQRWTVVLAGLYSIFNHTLEVLSQDPRRSLFTECHVTRSSPQVKASFNLILDQIGS